MKKVMIAGVVVTVGLVASGVFVANNVGAARGYENSINENNSTSYRGGDILEDKADFLGITVDELMEKLKINTYHGLVAEAGQDISDFQEIRQAKSQARQESSNGNNNRQAKESGSRGGGICDGSGNGHKKGRE